MVFVNFLDRGIETKMSKNVYELRIPYKEVKDLDTLKEYSSHIKEDTLELEECLAKIKIEYPTILYDIRMYGQSIVTEVYIDKDTYEEDDDWNDDDDFFDFARQNRVRDQEQEILRNNAHAAEIARLGIDAHSDDDFFDDEGEEDRHETWLRNR